MREKKKMSFLIVASQQAHMKEMAESESHCLAIIKQMIDSSEAHPQMLKLVDSVL